MHVTLYAILVFLNVGEFFGNSSDVILSISGHCNEVVAIIV